MTDTKKLATVDGATNAEAGTTGGELSMEAHETLPQVNDDGKVAQVLNERELVINIGRADGVQRGMKFAVLAAKPTEITDPDTGEVLGELDREKVRVKITEVHANMAVARTYESWTVGGVWFSNVFEEKRREYRTFHYSPGSIPAPIDDSDSYVKIGDRVKRIED
jgi:hypothetical protein